MASLHAFAASLALVLPILGQSTVTPATSSSTALALGEAAHGDPGSAPQCSSDQSTPQSIADQASPLKAMNDRQVARQVRIERRVVIRISPQSTANRSSLLPSLPQQSLATRYEERKMSKCIPVSQIAGVQTGSGNQLILFLKNRMIVRASLEKACRARDYYSGFYVERSKDGNICISRDKLQSRTGASCELERLRQLIAVSK